MGLAVVDHLQAMLCPAQVSVRRDQLFGDLRRHAVLFGQGRESGDGGGRPERRHAAAPDQLLSLGEEFDLPDAAATELEVVAADGDFGTAAMCVDLALDGMNVLDRREIQVLAPEERFQMPEKTTARFIVSRHHPGLDQGCALPVLAGAFVVSLRRRDGNRYRGRPRVRPQPEVGAKDIAVPGPGFQHVDEVAHDADEKPRHVLTPGIGEAVGVVKGDQVDIAGIIELMGAELAETEDEEARFPFRRSAVFGRDLPGRSRVLQQRPQRSADREIGETAERAGHLGQVPGARDIGDGGHQRCAPPRDAQTAHDVFAGIKIVERGKGRAERRFYAGGINHAKKGRFGKHAPCKPGTIAENGA